MVAFYRVENWRGKRAWEHFKRGWEAKGEHFDVASLVPKSVPSEQNFAMTPLLKPLLDYGAGPSRWRDPEGIERADAVAINLTMPGLPYLDSEVIIDSPVGPSVSSTRPPKLGRWASGQRTDLKAWQAFYRGNTNYPAPRRPGVPAADVLTALSRFDGELAELRSAASRPFSVFPVHYEEDAGALLKHLAVLKHLAQVATLRALALLELDRSDEALRDVELALRFADSIKDEPILISQLVRVSIVAMALQPVQEGLADGRWNDAQIVTLQSRLASARILEGYALSVRGENSIFIGQIMDRFRASRYSLADISGFGDADRLRTWAIPDGWFYQNQLRCSRLLLEDCLPAVDLPRRRVDPTAVRRLKARVEELERSASPYNFMARIFVSAYDVLPMKFACGEAGVQLAMIACGLERYHRARGAYPESLDALVPQFLSLLPCDIIGGYALKYRPTTTGRFLLYSVGWNETDEGGQVALKKDASADWENGDWVWGCPTK